MPFRPPASFAKPYFRLLFFDVVIALVSPPLALYLRHAHVFSHGAPTSAVLYWFVSFASSLIAFVAFGVSRGIPAYLSVRDVTDLAKAVFAAEAVTGAVVFTVTRLENVPRSVPAIHALILGAGLLAVRLWGQMSASKGRPHKKDLRPLSLGVIVIGVTELASLYVKFIEACAPGKERAIAMLDEDRHLTGRSVNGVRVYGTPSDLEPLIREFEVHGVHTDRVVVSVDEDEISEESLRSLRRVCARFSLDFVSLPEMFGIDAADRAPRSAIEADVSVGSDDVPRGYVPNKYFRYKRVFDVIHALFIAIFCSPILIIIWFMVLFDVGLPILFWQERLGRNGQIFSLYKIRTLRPAFDLLGQKIPEEERVSRVGRFLRRTRLDEVAQLLNILVGDMSLVGPRPLLERDQPSSPSLRLMVRPGITGWAQVNGGTLLSPEEKETLDEWYIRNASVWLDFRILGLTALSLIRGDRRAQGALDEACTANSRAHESRRAAVRKSISARPEASLRVNRPVEDAEGSAPLRSF